MQQTIFSSRPLPPAASTTKFGHVPAHPPRLSLDHVPNSPTCEYNCASSLEYNINELLTTYNAVVVASANNQADFNDDEDEAWDWCESTELTQSPARMGYGGMFENPQDPNAPLVITVGGTDPNDALWVEGEGDGSNTGSCVSIYAPADLLKAAHISTTTSYRNQSNPDVSSGTSWSAAVVSGVAARILDAHPSWTPRQVWNEIKSIATELDEDFDGDGNNDNDILIYAPPTL